MRIDYYNLMTYVYEGEMKLIHNDPAGAIASLEEVQKMEKAVPQNLLAINPDTKESQILPTSSLQDEIHLSMALAHLRLGEKEKGREFADKLIGYFSRERLKDWMEEVRKALELPAREKEKVTVDPLMAQDFTLEMLDGESVKLSDYQGKVVLLNFWSTWCYWCLQEMPILDKFQKAHAEDGVILLTISKDRFEDRPNIKPTLEKHNLDLTVLLEDPEQLTEYEYSGVPSLYVIDREGKIAMARSGYSSDLEDRLESKILPIVRGQPTLGRTLITIEQAPEGFGLLWTENVKGGIQAIMIAPPVGQQAGEVGALGRQGLMRWSSDGELFESKPLEGDWFSDLHVSDLDGNGSREWIAFGFRDFKVLDSEGELYWEHEGENEIKFAAIKDLDGNGTKEILFKDGKKIIAYNTTPKERWKTPRIADLDNLVTDPEGIILAQVGDLIMSFDASGVQKDKSWPAPKGWDLTGSMVLDKVGRLDFFKGSWDRKPLLGHDIDGDGQEDIVIANWESMRAYDQSGKMILKLGSDEETLSAIGIGNLDGLPGDEVALDIENYGLVVLGRKK